MSFSPARSQMTSQGSFRLRIALPLIRPGITNGLSGTRGIRDRTFTAPGERVIVLGPVLRIDRQGGAALPQGHQAPRMDEHGGIPAAPHGRAWRYSQRSCRQVPSNGSDPGVAKAGMMRLPARVSRRRFGVSRTRAR